MKRTLKAFTFVTVAIVLCFSTITTAFASANIPEATSDFYVNDFASVFSEEEKNTLMDNAVSLANENDGIQVVVTTVESLGGETVEDYAYDMYNKYGIGKNDMGLLILLSTEDRKIRVEVGKSMEAYINDSKAGRFMDEYAIPYLKENKFNEGLISLQEALISEIESCLSTETIASNGNTATLDIGSIALGLLLFILFVLIIGGIIYGIIIIVKKVKERKNHIAELDAEIKRLKEEKIVLKEKHKDDVEGLTSSIRALTSDNSELDSKLKATQKELSNLNSRYQRILKIYPDADNKVDAMIEAELIEKDKQAAKLVDSLIASVIDLNPSKDIVGKINSVISRYSSLTQNQQKYIVSDIRKLKVLYNDSVKLKEEYERKVEEERIRKLTENRKNKASDVTKEILGIISLVGIAKANDLPRLKNAKRLYDNLDFETQKYVDDSVISRLENMLSAAKRDKEEEEEAERRRRQASYSSSSSFGSGSSSFRGGGFGGFGGRSGGGGSSRGF